MSEPVQWTLSANYIENEPDLQFRLFIRMLLRDGSYNLTNDERARIMHDEADRLPSDVKENQPNE